jgi:hypothetical protein
LTYNAAKIERRREQIESFLRARGAECQVPTNQWEILRFRAGVDTGIVYKKADGSTTLVGPAKEAITAFFKGMPWSAGVAVKRRRAPPRVRTVLDRDGDRCFLCGRPLDDDITEEHLVPVTAGGPDHISNVVLAHRLCNERMGHLSVMEKIRMREANLFLKETDHEHH